ncbi:MAG: hypothetical protein R3268_13235 [Acidiferrobacterales bacterium]|nr:hypothetical protein [Acidiferrobacterales bacterium]
MYARVTRYQCDPARLDQWNVKLGAIKQELDKISGVVDIQIGWRRDGTAVAFQVFDSQETADAAIPQVQAIWSSLANFLVDAPSAETFDHVAGAS